MGDESPKPASTSTGAVFLSYASQDAEAAQRICTALRSAGVEVWFDQSELRGGDAWDRKIRDQIRHCALFIPVISAHAQARLEGYFRREWKFAVERKRDIADELAFLLPVVIDEIPERGAAVPEGFHEVQWTRLPGGAVSQEFIAHVCRLLTGHQDDSGHRPATTVLPASPVPSSPPRMRVRIPVSSRLRWMLTVSVGVLVAGAAVYVALDKFRVPKPAQPAVPLATSAGVPAAFSPPPHSIAVLPFVNLSGDASQDYFSDGLTEELLNSLAEMEGLQVAARTSSFSFKEHPDIATVAHKLNVGAVLEGSVRRSEHTVRVTAQLINAVTGFHLWSKTYDRNLGDVLKLQTDIATAVAGALKVALLGDVAAKVELGGTRNPAAFDAYLRGAKSQSGGHDAKEVQAAINAFTDAISLDPNYALAYAARSVAVSEYAGYWTSGVAAIHEGFEKAVADGRKAILLAPELGEGHRALAQAFESLLDFQRASEEYGSAVALAPGNARVLRGYGTFSIAMGRTDAGVAAIRHVVALDPLNRDSHVALGDALSYTRKYEAAIAAYNDALALDSGYSPAYAGHGLAQYMLGDLRGATSSCEMKTGDFVYYLVCLAVTYHKLGRQTDAEAILAKLKTWMGEGDAAQYAEIYAQWGDKESALRWLETAWRLRDAGLGYLRIDPLLDPLRHEPRFQAIERELKFPN